LDGFDCAPGSQARATHPAVLSDQIHEASTAIPLLDVLELV
jgi:hypothetical protein